MNSLDSVTDHAGYEECSDGADSEENFWQKTARKQKETGMARLDDLAYDPERLACTEREKDACLETVRKLIRLCYEIRRNGVLAAGVLAETERDPFFRACLLEFELDEGYIERENGPARLDRLPVEQRRQLLQKAEPDTLAMALRGAGTATEDELLEVLGEEERERMEREWDYGPRGIGLFAKDVERAQSELLAMRES